MAEEFGFSEEAEEGIEKMPAQGRIKDSSMPGGYRMFYRHTRSMAMLVARQLEMNTTSQMQTIIIPMNISRIASSSVLT